MKYMDNGNHNKQITNMFEDYDEFKEKLRQVFALNNKQQNAERSI